ncbi:MAG TPA: YceD family protein [Candidatus Paceibacterota bacterium]|jgi:uncharacterized protein|nr:YceD family protein [Candidatus Paceibacterota bacterium]
MSLTINLRHLESRNLVLRGELPLAELDWDVRDEMIRVVSPVEYDIEIEKLDDALLIQGELHVALECECVRCLKKFKRTLELKNWTLHLPLEGEDTVSVDNDCVDLTPFVREDILLGFPQHPRCKPDCVGLKPKTGKSKKFAGNEEPKPSAWAELNKLKL